MNERHSYFKSDLKARAEDGGAQYIEGYFAVFDQETELWPGYYERIGRQAFDNSLKDNDIRCLFNHDTGFVLGRTGSGTLELRADAHGLWGRVKLNPADRQALDVYARVERGDISGCSFGFTPVRESSEDRADGIHYTVEEADTCEVSVCTFPAYPQTEIQARQRESTASRRDALKKKLEGIKLC